MKLGAFSVSLAVQDLAASRAFYQKLGFEPVGGDPEHNWQILRNGDTTIGLFQGMFESNILTFNPGWDAQNQELDSFEDVRSIQKRLKARRADAGERGRRGGERPRQPHAPRPRRERDPDRPASLIGATRPYRVRAGPAGSSRW